MDSLSDSIERVGLLQPIVIDGSNRLIAGLRRITVAKQLNWTEIPVYVVSDLDDVIKRLDAERDENICRKEFTITEAVSVGLAMEKLKSRNAKGRQGTRTDKHSGKLPECSAGDTRDKVGETIGLSGRTYEKAKAVSATGRRILPAFIAARNASAEQLNQLAAQQKFAQVKDKSETSGRDSPDQDCT